ncbi:MAG TPA: glycosyltransferase [Candidatus Limnocylindrales bacterium]
MPDSRPGVLHVIANLDTGGAQEVVRTLAPALAAAGFRPVVATLRDGPLRSAIEDAGVPVVTIPGRRHAVTAPHRSVPELRRVRRDLAAVVADHRIALIQTHLLRSLDFVVLSLRREAGVRGVLWTVHNARLGLRPDQVPASAAQRILLGPKRAGYRAAYRLGARIGDGFVAVSDEVAASIAREIGPPADRISVIANGVDTERYPAPVDRAAVRRELGLAEDATFLLSIGKLMRQKGHEILVEAVARLDDPRLVVAIAGEGELRETIERRIGDAGVGDRVRLLGLRRDVPQLLAAADAFVLPSLWEGLPMALLEAMASGLPVLATDVSGTRQVLEDEAWGLLVPGGDAVRLAAGLRELLAVARSPERSAAMGKAARDRVVARFGVRSQAEAHAALYRSILERRAATPATVRA